MKDLELFERFATYARENGYTAEQAARLIGATRASFFNWKKGAKIGTRFRRAMMVLTFKETASDDHFLQVVLENWPKLDQSERAQVAGLAAQIAEDKKTAIHTASDSDEVAI